MSDLQNPLFDEEKEFLERKKLEYERALRGDVEGIKEKSVVAGKVALVGAGLAGSVWLITKAFGSKKKKRRAKNGHDNGYDRHEAEGENFDEGFEGDNGFGAEYYTAGNGKRYKSVTYRKSAADSAQAFMENEPQKPRPEHGQGHEADDLGFGSKAAPQAQPATPSPVASSAFDPEEFEDDPFKDLPYDDSRRLPASHAFDDADGEQEANPAPARPSFVGQVLQNFLKSDTGKVLVAQAAAVVLAVVTKKVSEFFPADKNPDLASSPAVAPAETGFAPAVSLASPDSPDASTHTPAI
ncbi:hypothetical protein I2I05_01380 [Hymenobacter sp. BT683]|uniref:YtxH domain-containing protein n=1 Tax=Hymenobacter jeongseonensis TaxID=2791027 RepID=A0ABS0ICJ4_9BACT|nr:hypothetical protein [Hymenobacter jeongseonensis]MBF9236035.1 hypothetical protein [Hymenobacter jeongseonensis]